MRHSVFVRDDTRSFQKKKPAEHQADKQHCRNGTDPETSEIRMPLPPIPCTFPDKCPIPFIKNRRTEDCIADYSTALCLLQKSVPAVYLPIGYSLIYSHRIRIGLCRSQSSFLGMPFCKSNQPYQYYAAIGLGRIPCLKTVFLFRNETLSPILGVFTDLK